MPCAAEQGQGSSINLPSVIDVDSLFIQVLLQLNESWQGFLHKKPLIVINDDVLVKESSITGEVNSRFPDEILPCIKLKSISVLMTGL